MPVSWPMGSLYIWKDTHQCRHINTFCSCLEQAILPSERNISTNNSRTDLLRSWTLQTVVKKEGMLHREKHGPGTTLKKCDATIKLLRCHYLKKGTQFSFNMFALNKILVNEIYNLFLFTNILHISSAFSELGGTLSRRLVQSFHQAHFSLPQNLMFSLKYLQSTDSTLPNSRGRPLDLSSKVSPQNWK